MIVYMSESSQSLRFILSLRMNSSFITSRPDKIHSSQRLGEVVFFSRQKRRKFKYTLIKQLTWCSTEQNDQQSLEKMNLRISSP